MEGEWSYKLRKFLTPEEKDERDTFEDMDDMVNANKEVFISESHQKVMATEDEDVTSIDTHLTKNDAPPENVKDGKSKVDVSCLTGDTCESKDKAYTTAEI